MARVWPVAGKRGPILLAVVVLAALSGCAAFPFVGPTCGPGDTDVGTITDNTSEVHVKGELVRHNTSALVIDDGTGQAFVPLSGGLGDRVETGDCLIANGAAAPMDDSEYEALVLYSDLYKEEVVVGEEARRRS